MNTLKQRTYAGFLCGILLSSAACTTVQQPPTPQAVPNRSEPTSSPLPGPSLAPEVMGPQDFVGPSVPVVVPVFGPEPIQIRSVVLVLGPGVVKGFAHSGVIDALVSAKVPVGAILGSEMGALIGAIYSQDTNVNHLQWELMKFREDVFLSEKGLFPAHKLEVELHSFFAGKDLHTGRIPCVVALQMENTGAVELVSQGPVQDILRAAIAFPHVLDPGNWKGSHALSTKKALLSLIQEAKSLGLGPVVVIDTMGEANILMPPQGADLVIQPNLRDIDDLDFKKRTEAVFRGKKAVTDNLRELYHWAGMPEGDR